MNTAAEVKSTLVIDASAAIAIVTDPSAAASAISTRIAPTALIAPTILPYEFAQVLRRGQLAGTLPRARANQAFASFDVLAIELWPWEAFSARVWELRENLTAYDASYVALAELVGAPLITRDARISRAPGIRCAVEVF